MTGRRHRVPRPSWARVRQVATDAGVRALSVRALLLGVGEGLIPVLERRGLVGAAAEEPVPLPEGIASPGE